MAPTAFIPVNVKYRLFRAELKGRLAALTTGGSLPPGDLTPPDPTAETDRFRLVKMAERHGPVFRAWVHGKPQTCICDPQLAQKVFTENRQHLRTATVDMTRLFATGILRNMEGEDHSTYRRAFASAFRSISREDLESATDEPFRDSLEKLRASSGPLDSGDLAFAMKRLTTRILFRLILGLHPDEEADSELEALFNRFAPNGLPIVMRKKQKDGYAEVRLLYLQRIEREGVFAPSLRAWFDENGELDETVIGNLLSTTELVRHDVHGYWRWLILELSGKPDVMGEIAASRDRDHRRRLAGAAAYETLRMHQTEFLRRVTSKTLRVGDYVIPSGTGIMFCTWVHHRNPDVFDCPHAFEPSRFADEAPDWKKLIPFGMDHHRCPGAGWTVDLSEILVERLADEFTLQCLEYGKPRLASFHFETGRDSLIGLAPRNCAPEKRQAG